MAKYIISIGFEAFESEGKDRLDALHNVKNMTVWTEEEWESVKNSFAILETTLVNDGISKVNYHK